jgi:hypothetical protein
MNEISFSLFELNAPVSVVPARFGFQFNNTIPHPQYYYRPEIGFGVGPLSISYAYNLMLNKLDRKNAERHMLSVRINFPVLGY